MAESTRRGRMMTFFLLPAIVAAVAVIGFVMFRASRQVEQERQRSVIEATLSLANEKVGRLDRVVIEQDNVLVAEVDPTEPQQVSRRWLPTAARETPTVRAVLVIDLSVPGGQVLAHASRAPGLEEEAFRRLLVTRMLADLDLGRPPIEELRHLHRAYGGQSYLVSYWQRLEAGRPLMVLVWHDVPRLVHDVFPRLFTDASGASRVNVVDEEGRQVYGAAMRAGGFTVGRPFPTTLYGWRLQVALTAADELGNKAERRRLLEVALVTTACVVIVLGVAFVLFAVEKERRLSEQKSEFVANVSHELKTPLSLVRMFAELLLTDRVPSEEKKKQYLEIMVIESERLTALIENVLDFARVERGKATFDFAPGDAADVALRAAEIYRYRAEREGVDVEVVAPRGLGTVRLDARAVELAVINLLDNALKYAKEGKKITVRVERKKRTVEIQVADMGPGIARDDQRRIFDRFVRGKSARDARVRGTGIGLSLVKHIAEEHGGYARVESEPGKGSVFTIGLPVLAEAAVVEPSLGTPG
jgi:two-component system, OmpR family, phosphate regulon sensor histidine kinase PhoR